MSTGLKLDDLPADLGRRRLVERGAAVWRKGEPFHSIYFLRHGHVCITVEDERGRQVIARIVRPGEPFGMSCFSESRRRQPVTSAVAGAESEVIEIDLDSFRAFLTSNPDAMTCLLSTMSERLAYAEERIRILSNHGAEDRICALLEQLALRFGTPSRRKPGFHAVHLTHSELAQLSGLSRAHVSIMMGRLRSRAMVAYGRSTALLIDLKAIEDRRRGQSSV